MQRTAPIVLVVALVAGGWAFEGAAATCPVPSASHPTIQAAVDDVACTEVVLAAQSFAESPVVARSLALRGAGSGQTFIQGRLEVSAGQVALEGFHVAASGGALTVHSGAEVSGFDVVAFDGLFEVPMFADGFETGDMSRWSGASP